MFAEISSLFPSWCTSSWSEEDKWVELLCDVRGFFKAIKAFGANLWRFSFGKLVWLLYVSAQPWAKQRNQKQPELDPESSLET